jgi:hypothetical protein
LLPIVDVDTGAALDGGLYGFESFVGLDFRDS